MSCLGHVIVSQKQKKKKKLSNTPPKNILSWLWRVSVLLQECLYYLPRTPSYFTTGGSSTHYSDSVHRVFSTEEKGDWLSRKPTAKTSRHQRAQRASGGQDSAAASIPQQEGQEIQAGPWHIDSVPPSPPSFNLNLFCVVNH